MRDFERLLTCPHCGAKIYKSTYLTIQQVVEMTGYHYNTVLRHCEELEGVKRLGRWKFPLAKVLEFMDGNGKI